MSLLSIRNLCKSYGALIVTDDLNLTVAEGELHAVIGPNGAGKTTLIAQLAGQLPSNSGRVILDGEDITALAMPARGRRGLSRSFQITSILPGFTVLENVATAVQARMGSSFRFFARVADDAALNDHALAALARVGLQDSARKRAGALSHGEKRQLELAVALATEPRLLLLDEPLAGTSGAEADRLIRVIDSLKGQVAVLLIEHDMDAVFALADRISVLVNGRLIATGDGAVIRADPQVRAAYLGEGA